MNKKILYFQRVAYLALAVLSVLGLPDFIRADDPWFKLLMIGGLLSLDMLIQAYSDLFFGAEQPGQVIDQDHTFLGLAGWAGVDYNKPMRRIFIWFCISVVIVFPIMWLALASQLIEPSYNLEQKLAILFNLAVIPLAWKGFIEMLAELRQQQPGQHSQASDEHKPAPPGPSR